MRLKISICFVLAAVTVAIYWPAGHFGIVYYDDSYFVTENPAINGGLTWHGIWWSLTGIVVSNWHPVTNFSFLLTHQFFGQSPTAEHWVNIIFHAANAALLFLVLNRLTCSIWRAAIVGAIFAWHPLRVESVAWISERKDVLCGFFFMLAIFCYAREANRIPVAHLKSMWRDVAHPLTRYQFTLIFFVLALMSKPMAVSLPLLLLILDVWPLKRSKKIRGKENAYEAEVESWGKLLLEKWPFAVLSAGMCVLTFVIQKNTQSIAPWHAFHFGAMIANIVMGYAGYLGKFFWPTNLAVIYPIQNIADMTGVWMAGMLLLAISIVCVLQAPRRPYLLAGWLWYLISLAPVIGIVQVGIQAMADRYSYLPLIGPGISLVWLAADWAEKLHRRKAFAVVAALLLCALAIVSRRQVELWQDTVTLFGHAINVTADNYAAHFSLGMGYQLEQGMTNVAMNQYRIALKLNPDDLRARVTLAATLMEMGKTTEADEEFEKVLRIDPNSTLALNDLAWTLSTNPDPAIRNGLYAVQLAQHACEVTHYQQPIFIGTLAAAYAEAGQFDDAIAAAQKAISVAQQNNENGLVKTNEKLLELYRAHKPYHEVPLVPAAK